MRVGGECEGGSAMLHMKTVTKTKMNEGEQKRAAPPRREGSPSRRLCVSMDDANADAASDDAGLAWTPLGLSVLVIVQLLRCSGGALKCATPHWI